MPGKSRGALVPPSWELTRGLAYVGAGLVRHPCTQASKSSARQAAKF